MPCAGEIDSSEGKMLAYKHDNPGSDPHMKWGVIKHGGKEEGVDLHHPKQTGPEATAHIMAKQERELVWNPGQK